MRYDVRAPLAGFTGSVVGVDFTDGGAQIDTTSDGGQAAFQFFQRHGYGLTPVGEPEPEQPQTPEEPPEPYDPGAHTVEEVVTYLAGADPEETARVLAAEQAGKARAGILNKQPTPTPAPSGDEQKGEQQ